MPKAFSNWKPLEHGPLEQLADNLWRVEGSIPDMALRRHMIVVRIEDEEGGGKLWIHNGVAVNDEVREQIEALGEPTWLIVPNGFHRLDAAVFKERYPQLKVYCPKGAKKKVAQVVEVDGAYDDMPPFDGIEVEPAAGTRAVGDEGVFKVRSSDGATLIFNDILFNQPHLPGLFGAIYRLIGSSGEPQVTLVARLLMVKDKLALKEQLLRLADTEGLQRILPGHIRPILEDPAAVLRKVANRL